MSLWSQLRDLCHSNDSQAWLKHSLKHQLSIIYVLTVNNYTGKYLLQTNMLLKISTLFTYDEVMY